MLLILCGIFIEKYYRIGKGNLGLHRADIKYQIEIGFCGCFAFFEEKTILETSCE